MADLEQAAVWHRQIAALVAAADRAGVAPDELPAVRARLAAQVVEFTRVSSLAGAPLPALQPTAGEIAAVMPALGDLGSAASGQLLRTASATLDAADVALGTSPAAVSVPAYGGAGTTTTTATSVLPAPTANPSARTSEPVGGSAQETPTRPAPKGVETWRAGPRNSLVYGACALVVLVLEAVLFYSVTNAALASPLCVLVFPAFAWLAGYLLVGVLFEPAAGTKLDRTPKLGAVVCFAPSVIVVLGFIYLLIRGILSF